MAALAAFNITNLIVEVSGGEVPIMDGSSQSFVGMITQAGIKDQHAAKSYIKVLKKVAVFADSRFACFEPAENFIIDYYIAYIIKIKN